MTEAEAVAEAQRRNRELDGAEDLFHIERRGADGEWTVELVDERQAHGRWGRFWRRVVNALPYGM